MSWDSNRISESYKIYHMEGLFNRLFTENSTVKSWELGATFLLSYHSHERGMNRESKKELNRRIVGKLPPILLSYNWLFVKREVVNRELNRRIVGMVGSQRAAPSVEFSWIVNRVTSVKPVKLVKKLRGGALGVELWVTVLVNSIVSGLLHRSFYKVLAEAENMNNLSNLLNFTARG